MSQYPDFCSKLYSLIHLQILNTEMACLIWESESLNFACCKLEIFKDCQDKEVKVGILGHRFSCLILQ